MSASRVVRKKTGRSLRAGLLFPVSRIHRYFWICDVLDLGRIAIVHLCRFLKEGITSASRVKKDAPVYLAGVLQYLTYELLDSAGIIAGKQSRITPRHILVWLLKKIVDYYINLFYSWQLDAMKSSTSCFPVLSFPMEVSCQRFSCPCSLKRRLKLLRWDHQALNFNLSCIVHSG